MCPRPLTRDVGLRENTNVDLQQRNCWDCRRVQIGVRVREVSVSGCFTVYLIYFVIVFKVQEERGARREGLQQNTTRKVCLGARHGGKRLCLLITVYFGTQPNFAIIQF